MASAVLPTQRVASIGREFPDTLRSLTHQFILIRARVVGERSIARIPFFCETISSKHSSIMQKAMQMGPTKGNVVRLATRAGNCVYIEVESLIRNQWWRHSGAIVDSITDV